MEVDSLVILFDFRVKGNFPLLVLWVQGSYLDINGKLIGNYYGIYKYLRLHYIICLIMQVYAISLIINTEILIPLVFIRKYCEFNHVYTYIVNFIEFLLS